MNKLTVILVGIYITAHLGLMTSCKHEPILGDDITPIDTSGNPIDTNVTGTPCDPDKVYFENEILPILKSNCTFSDCHNSASAKDGVILESYTTVMSTADVKPYDLSSSDLYKVLISTDPKKRMPLDKPALPQAQIQLIAKWIQQGAQNLTCNPNIGLCDTTSVSYSQHIKPVIDTQCKGCHSGNPPAGGLDFTTYNGIQATAVSGKLYPAVSWATGAKKMPQGGSKLPDCTISKIKTWVNAGAPNN